MSPRPCCGPGSSVENSREFWGCDSKEGIFSSKTTTWAAGEPPQAVGSRRKAEPAPPGWAAGLERAGIEQQALGTPVLGGTPKQSPPPGLRLWEEPLPKIQSRENLSQEELAALGMRRFPGGSVHRTINKISNPINSHQIPQTAEPRGPPRAALGGAGTS